MGKSIKVLKDVEVDYATVIIVKGLANGLTISEIAQSIKVKVRTLEGRVAVIKSTFNVSTLPELVALFFRKGLIK
jgi:DNA-binding NarL/FixJ family response regulator